jgi:hypothetical protein
MRAGNGGLVTHRLSCYLAVVSWRYNRRFIVAAIPEAAASVEARNS